MGEEVKRVFDLDPETGIRRIKDWGPECARGFVRDSRFGSGQVIKGTNRQKTRANRKAAERFHDDRQANILSSNT